MPSPKQNSQSTIALEPSCPIDTRRRASRSKDYSASGRAETGIGISKSACGRILSECRVQRKSRWPTDERCSLDILS